MSLPPNSVCVLVATFSPKPMIMGHARYNGMKKIKTVVGVFSTFEDYLRIIRNVPTSKIEKYARCKLNVENKRLPYIYDYEGSVPQMEYTNNLKAEPYYEFWSPYFNPEWDFEKDPDILTTDKNLNILPPPKEDGQ
jgi:hypothetical protein